MDSDPLIPSVSCVSLQGSSKDGDHSHSQDQFLSCEPMLESFIKPSNSNTLVVSGVQSTFNTISESAVENLYSVDPDTEKDPDLSVVTFSLLLMLWILIQHHP